MKLVKNWGKFGLYWGKKSGLNWGKTGVKLGKILDYIGKNWG